MSTPDKPKPSRVTPQKPRLRDAPMEHLRRTFVPERLPDGQKARMASPRTARKVIMGALAAGGLGTLTQLSGGDVLFFVEAMVGNVPSAVDALIMGAASAVLTWLVGRQTTPDPQDDLAR